MSIILLPHSPFDTFENLGGNSGASINILINSSDDPASVDRQMSLWLAQNKNWKYNSCMIMINKRNMKIQRIMYTSKVYHLYSFTAKFFPDIVLITSWYIVKIEFSIFTYTDPAHLFEYFARSCEFMSWSCFLPPKTPNTSP